MGNGNRVPLIAMLVAIEVVIVGVAVYMFSGHGGTIFAGGNGFHSVDVKAPGAIAPIAVGNSPRIVVDDSDDRVYVTVSNDRQVHVIDEHSYHGTIFGQSHVEPLKVERTSGGVSISRASGSGSSWSIGNLNETNRIDVQVPADSVLAFNSCMGADITGVQGGVTAHAAGGSIQLNNVAGPIDLRDDDEFIAAHNVSGDTFNAHATEGRIELDGVTSTKIIASSNEGRIIAAIPAGTNAVVTARTADGHIVHDGTRVSRDDDSDVSTQTFTLGSGSGSISLTTDDGNITISTNGGHS